MIARDRLEKALGPAPRWALPVALREAAERLGACLPRAELGVGEALGVIVIPRGAGSSVAEVVRLRVRRSAQDASAPSWITRDLFSPATQAGLIQAMHQAMRLYPAVILDVPGEDLVLEILDAEGEPLTFDPEVAEPNAGIEGHSLELSAALATWSYLAGKPLRGDVVASAEMPGGDLGQLCIPGFLGGKRDAVLAIGARFMTGRSRRPGGEEGILFCPTLGDAVREAFPGQPRWNDPAAWRAPDTVPWQVALHRLDGEYRARPGHATGWLAPAFETLLAAMPEGCPGRPLAIARAAACHTHRGEPGRAYRLLRDLLDGFDLAQMDGADEAQARIHLAVVLEDLYRFDEAAQAARDALEAATAIRSHEKRFEARSTLGRILVAAGEVDEGIEHLQTCVRQRDAEQHPECPRAHNYLVDALFRAGRFEEAEREANLAEEHNRLRPQTRRQREGNDLYLAYIYGNGRLRRFRRDPAGASLPHAGVLERRAGESPRWPDLGLRRLARAITFHEHAADLPDPIPWSASPESYEEHLANIETDAYTDLEDYEARIHGWLQPVIDAVYDETARIERDGSQLLAWLTAITLLDAILAYPPGERALERCQAWFRWVTDHVPTRYAEGFFAPWIERGRGATRLKDLKRAALAILEREPH